MTNNSAIFTTQMLEFDKAPLRVFDKEYFVNTYLVDPHLDGGTYDSTVYFVYRTNIPDSLMTYMVSHPRFKTMYCPKDGLIVLSFSQEGYVEGVVKPFLRGQYSKIDRDYVEKYFPNVPTHKRYGTRCVLDKCEVRRRDWEERIGVSLPDGAEVWSKPKLENETFDPHQVLVQPQA